LAAILRALGIPTGICYQRLVLFEDPSDGYSLHALNASYLASHGRWVRFDARGNRAGIDAQFSLGEERLAFSPRSELDECDYPEIFGDPAEIVLLCLTRHRDSKALYASGLPSAL
jgi:transglutaminase-like putative cysteine protease